MRKRLWICLVSVVFLLLSAVTAPAQAASWSVDVSELKDGQLVSAADGSVTVFGCNLSQSVSPVAATINSSGQRVNSIPDTTASCQLGTVGAGHVMYATATQQSSLTEATAAFENNRQLWKKVWTSSCGLPLNILWREVGPDKHLYEVLSDGQCGASKYYLHKVNPATGNEVFRQELADIHPYRWFVTRSGIVFLALGSSPALHYYDLRGNKLKTVAIDDTLEYNTYGSADNGRFYIANNRRPDSNGSCPTFQSETHSLTGYDQLGKFFEHRFAACKRAVSVTPTSNGIVVIALVDPAGTLTLVSFFADGTKRIVPMPKKRSDGKWFDPAWGQLIADTNGNVVLRRATYADETQTDESYSETYFLLNATSLATLATVQTDKLSKGLTQNWQLGFAMSAKKLYLALNEPCSSGSGCKRKLHNVPFGNVGMDYPRGSVLTAGAIPELRYIALGDSFTSGEGNEPFFDSSGCHRSVGAFPRWLDADTSLPLSLANEDFMACSGATIADVRSGKNGEQSQLNRVPSNARVITISVGGNDAKFGDYVRACVKYECDVNSDQYLIATKVIDGSLRQDLASLYKDILAKAPQAHLYVVGYPYIIPTIGERGTYCSYMSDNELSAARILTAGLNLRAYQATKDIQTPEARQRIHFVDPTLSSSPFNGHDVCGESSFFHRVNIVYEAYSLHPNANGVKAYKQIVKVALGY
ncbi:MAG TPA: SGNH/GDSL hydrolase family protein [Candidatus Saccharimonadales bacterium]